MKMLNHVAQYLWYRFGSLLLCTVLPRLNSVHSRKRRYTSVHLVQGRTQTQVILTSDHWL